MSKTARDNIKDELSSLIEGFDRTFGPSESAGVESIIDKKINALRNKSSIVDIKKMNDKFKKEASSVLDLMYKFYLGMDVINEGDYIKKKKDLLSVNLYGIMFQLNTVKAVLEKMAEELTSGNLSPKMIEAFSILQEKYTNIIKSNASYMLFLEDAVRSSLIGAQPEQLPEGVPTTEEQLNEVEKKNSKYYLSSNQRKLIDDLNVEKTEVEEVDMTLINPNMKPQLMEKIGVTEKMISTGDENVDYYEGIMDIM